MYCAGKFRSGNAARDTDAAVCQDCTGFTTTSAIGASACDLCQPGYAGATCALCLDGTYASGDDKTGTCIDCPRMPSGFPFKAPPGYSAQGELFAPLPTSRDGAPKFSDCVAKWAQNLDDNWYIPAVPGTGGNARRNGFVEVDMSQKTNNFVNCVAECAGDDDCQLVTFQYGLTPICWMRKKATVTGSK
jgi:hypothetical protein